jgi:hypothetical protein
MKTQEDSSAVLMVLLLGIGGFFFLCIVLRMIEAGSMFPAPPRTIYVPPIRVATPEVFSHMEGSCQVYTFVDAEGHRARATKCSTGDKYEHKRGKFWSEFDKNGGEDGQG